MNNFAYPVLMEQNSSYEDSCKFEINYMSHNFDEENMNINMNVELTAKSLERMMERSQAYLLVKMSSKIYSKSVTYKMETKLKNKYEIKFPIFKILENDYITIQAYILATDNMEIDWNKDLKQIYKRYRKIKVNKNSQLAISNAFKLYYQRYDDSLISIEKSELLDDKGIKINLEKSDAIVIKVGNRYADAFKKLTDTEVIEPYMNTNILFNALFYTGLMVLNSETGKEYTQKKWFEGYRNLFEKATEGKDIMEIIDGNSEMDINEIFECTQKMMNNKLETSLINLQRDKEKIQQ